ncbi:MAG TPA: hypothetical protein VHM70_22340 [Polyangiaceae bacterium]|nr:hypothetical protein [Polyangiaceae bacterium]
MTRKGDARIGFLLRTILPLSPTWLCSCASLPPLSPAVERMPAQLSQTGLYSSGQTQLTAAGVHPFTPSFPLWSDGASKRRWIYLPQGTQIDTHDMDSWQFPVGTKVWKEFSIADQRLETRLFQRVSSDDQGWVAAAYTWDAQSSEARLDLEGKSDVLETAHDVPEARACMTCHGGRAHAVLGFSAIQLAHASADPEEYTLDRLAQSGLLSHPPKSTTQIPGNPIERAALGYLHSNCGSCHNSARPAWATSYAPSASLDLWLRTDALSAVDVTPTYRTALSFVKPGNPESSSLYKRLANTSWFLPRMPPLATEVVDDEGAQVIATWIRQLSLTTH